MIIPNTHFHRKSQSGNAAIYVLIVVALFAALSFTVARQNNSSDSATLSDEKADIIANQILAYPYQVKQAIEMMTMTGTDPATLDFTQPGQSGYDDAPHIKKIFHPGGGGLTLARLPAESVAQIGTNPVAGWYLSMFNNLEWSTTTANDVMLVAYQISKKVCERINFRLTGKTEIPTLGNTIPNVLIARESPPGMTIHSGSNITTFNVATCADCEEKPTLCVQDGSGTYGFYSMILNR